MILIRMNEGVLCVLYIHYYCTVQVVSPFRAPPKTLPLFQRQTSTFYGTVQLLDNTHIMDSVDKLDDMDIYRAFQFTQKV